MTPEQMSKFIRTLRGNMSLRDFAAKCDVSHTTIDNLERGIDPRTGKPPQIKMATYEKIISACNLPSIISIADPEPDFDVEAFLAATHRALSRTNDQEDQLWGKICRLSPENRNKVDGYVSALLDEQDREEIAKTKNA
jgi:transcriptional regulator with XRE-family HTH domain